MEVISPRQADIMNMLRQDGRVGVEDLAELFNVSPQTIRKDLNELGDQDLLQRVHGGAVLSSGVKNFEYEARRLLAVEEKRHIGILAASLIPDNCTLLINIGTTTEQVAIGLRGKEGMMAITNNINVVNILSGTPGFEVIVAGGVVRPTDGGVIGEATVDFIKQFKVDYAVIGASAIDEDGSLLDYDYREVKVAQAIIDNARQTILVVDSMKLERSAPVRIGHLTQMDYVVTDKPLPAKLQTLCTENDVIVKVTENISLPSLNS
ncbi:MAG: DeoR/GlpR family DNA-binding transcription regulator [Sneathiella sp.]